MISRPFPAPRLALYALLFCLPASAGWARGEAHVPALAALTDQRQAAPAGQTGLADHIDALLSSRFEAIAAVPAAEERRQALKDLSQFADLTVAGIIDASPSGEVRSLMEDRLRPILAHHQYHIAAALAALGEQAESRYPQPASAGRSRVADGP